MVKIGYTKFVNMLGGDVADPKKYTYCIYPFLEPPAE